MRDVIRNAAAAAPPALNKRLLDILSLEDLEPAAERYLPHCIFSFISGGVETNASRHENRAAFQDYDFHPRVLNDVSGRSTVKTLFGEAFSAPFGIAPMGGSGLAGYRADLALASAAAAENIPFILSGASLIRMEDVAQANPRAWFQAYLPVDRAAIDALIDRVAAAGYRHLVVTADVPVGGNRENLVRAGYTSPLRPTLKLALDAATHPRWLFGTALRTLRHHGMPYYENSTAERGMAVFSNAAVRAHLRDQLSWRDIERIRVRWQGKLIVKGILAPADAATARRIGCDGVIVSNHGGRQLDGAAAPLRVLPRIAEVAQGMTVMMDSGIRRGTDVIKAIALGADFVFAGRPFLYAAAIGQQAGIRRAIDLLRSEIHRNLAFLGSRDLSELDGRVMRIAR
ncbi:MAG: alpha-hydroxy acid oxidase [Pseudomonadota bacterium]